MVTIDRSRPSGNGMAYAALGCALVGFVAPVIAFVSVLLGAIAFSLAHRDVNSSEGLSRTALILGVIGSVIGIIRFSVLGY